MRKAPKLPETPGVYLMRDAASRIIYVGKAGNLQKRVRSYFVRAHDARIEKLVSLIGKIDYIKTETALEALILEADLIKRHQPVFNVKEKDNKSFLFVGITGERFPRVAMVRGKDRRPEEWSVGPFVAAASLREALKIIRRIFPFNTHSAEELRKIKRPCLDYQIGLCPGACAGVLSLPDYRRTVRSIKLIFRGKKKEVLRDLEREMKTAGQRQEFERAAKLKKQIFALRHINDVALITDHRQLITDRTEKNFRIEGYDISNISGQAATGAMAVFSSIHGTFASDRNEYRKFRIRGEASPDDTRMLKEVLERRLNHPEWPLPQLILVDGGRSQVNVALRVLRRRHLKIPVLGMVKGPARKKTDVIGQMPKEVDLSSLILVRDEAHRLARSYHLRRRREEFLKGS